MEKDRKEICKIISGMLDSPNEHGIFPTTTAYNLLEQYCDGIRAEAIGWTHTDACVSLDNDKDPREKSIPEMLERAKIDLNT